jgi:hypothetical protein
MLFVDCPGFYILYKILKRSDYNCSFLYKKYCIVQESNPSLLRGGQAFYHWTNDTHMYVLLYSGMYCKKMSLFDVCFVNSVLWVNGSIFRTVRYIFFLCRKVLIDICIVVERIVQRSFFCSRDMCFGVAAFNGSCKKAGAVRYFWSEWYNFSKNAKPKSWHCICGLQFFKTLVVVTPSQKANISQGFGYYVHPCWYIFYIEFL